MRLPPHQRGDLDDNRSDRDHGSRAAKDDFLQDGPEEYEKFTVGALGRSDGVRCEVQIAEECHFSCKAKHLNFISYFIKDHLYHLIILFASLFQR
jgi:hypothetical protein